MLGPFTRSTCLLLLCLPVSFTQAREWTRFHGPNGSGESEATTVPARWTEDDYNWKVELPGIGHSCPVIWDNRIFLLSGDPDDASRFLLCLDTETGGIIWKRTFASLPHSRHALNNYASSTPAVDEHHVYVGWAAPDQLHLVTFDHAGNQVWHKRLGPFVARHGFGTSPVVVDDLVILSNHQQGTQLEGKPPGKSSIFAFDRITGDVVWETPRISDAVAYSSPCVYRPDDGPPQLIGCNTANGMYSLDLNTGQENWALRVFDKRTVSSPFMAGGMIFGSNGSGGGGNYVVALRPGNPPQEVYRITTQAPYVPTSVTRGDLIFLWSDNGIVSCIDAPTGDVVWRKRVGGTFFASPVRAANRIYNISKDGVVIVVAAEREFKELGRMPLGETSHSTPAVSGGRLYLRTLSHLVSIGGKRAS